MKTILLASFSLFLVSCGHHRDVRPGANGIHRVVVRAEEKEMGEQQAIRQANHYCEEFQKSAAFTSERTHYSGDVDEQTYKQGKALSRFVKTAGSGAYIYGGKKERNAGGVGTLGGASMDSALGKGYTTDMSFRCQ